MSNLIFTSTFNNEYIDKENTLFISDEQKRICSYKENTKEFIDIINYPLLSLLNGNSSINGTIEIPMIYNGSYERKLIIQWGRVDVVSGANTISFNSDYPNAIYNVQATPNGSDVNIGIDKIDLKTFKINSSNNARVFWLAIGQ